MGTCFSGSTVETADGQLKLFYTAHRRIYDEDYQVPCLVHADRSLSNFHHDERNPVLDNPGLPCFRDPKVIWHEPSQRWIMVITHGQSIGFYSSPDLSEWTHESDFGIGHGRHSDGPWECPDLFAMTGPDGAEHWILLVGIGSGGYAAGSGTQYFVGRFDGSAFVNDNRPGTTLWLDYGRDFYAAQTFFGGAPLRSSSAGPATGNRRAAPPRGPFAASCRCRGPCRWSRRVRASASPSRFRQPLPPPWAPRLNPVFTGAKWNCPLPSANW